MKFDHLRRLNESEETKVVAEAEYKHIREVKIEKDKLEEENEKLSQDVHENEFKVQNSIDKVAVAYEELKQKSKDLCLL